MVFCPVDLHFVCEKAVLLGTEDSFVVRFCVDFLKRDWVRIVVGVEGVQFCLQGVFLKVDRMFLTEMCFTVAGILMGGSWAPFTSGSLILDRFTAHHEGL